VAKFTVTSLVLPPPRLTVKTASTVPVSPSVTLMSPTVRLETSLSVMLPWAWGSVMLPPELLLRFTKSVSAAAGSSRVSSTTGTATPRVVVPAGKVRVPETVV
jgi:hypothetical protein